MRTVVREGKYKVTLKNDDPASIKIARELIGNQKAFDKEQDKEKRIIDALKALEGVKRLLLEVVKK